MSVDLNQKAYAKIMLHCLKHTSNDCYGILIGSVHGDIIKVVDAVPLFHNGVFSPELEIALKFVIF